MRRFLQTSSSRRSLSFTGSLYSHGQTFSHSFSKYSSLKRGGFGVCSQIRAKSTVEGVGSSEYEVVEDENESSARASEDLNGSYSSHRESLGSQTDGSSSSGIDDSALREMGKTRSPFTNYEFDIYSDAPYPIWWFNPEGKWYQAIMKGTKFSADILDQWHQFSGLPWWATIATGVVGIRLALAPLTLYSIRNAARAGDAREDIRDVINAYTHANQMLGSNASPPEKLSLATTTLSGLRAALHKAHCYPWRSIVLPFAHWPVILLGVFGARHLVMLGDESFETGGALWFTDLTVADTTYALPAAAYFLGYSFMEYAYGIQRPGQHQGMSGAPALMGRKFLSFIKNASQLWIICSIPLTYQFPSGLYIAWITGSLYGIVWVSLIRSKPVYYRITGRDPAEIERDRQLFDFVVKKADQSGNGGEGDSHDDEQHSSNLSKEKSSGTATATEAAATSRVGRSPFGKSEESLLKRSMLYPSINFIRQPGVYEVRPGESLSLLHYGNADHQSESLNKMNHTHSKFVLRRPLSDEQQEAITNAAGPVLSYRKLNNMIFSKRRSAKRCVDNSSTSPYDDQQTEVRDPSRRVWRTTSSDMYASPQVWFRSWQDRFRVNYVSRVDAKSNSANAASANEPRPCVEQLSTLRAASGRYSCDSPLTGSSAKISFDAVRLILGRPDALRRVTERYSVRDASKKPWQSLLSEVFHSMSKEINFSADEIPQELIDEAYSQIEDESMFEIVRWSRMLENEEANGEPEELTSEQQHHQACVLSVAVAYMLRMRSYTRKHSSTAQLDSYVRERSLAAYRGSRYAATLQKKREQLARFLEGREAPGHRNWDRRYGPPPYTSRREKEEQSEGALPGGELDHVIGVTHGERDVNRAQQENRRERRIEQLRNTFRKILDLYGNRSVTDSHKVKSDDETKSTKFSTTKRILGESDKIDLNEDLRSIAFEEHDVDDSDIDEPSRNRGRKGLVATDSQRSSSIDDDIAFLAERGEDPNNVVQDFLYNVLPAFRSGARSPTAMPLPPRLQRKVEEKAGMQRPEDGVAEESASEERVDYLKTLQTLIEEDEKKERDSQNQLQNSNVDSNSPSSSSK